MLFFFFLVIPLSVVVTLLFSDNNSQSTDSVHKEKENKEYSDDYIGIIIGALAALIVLLVCIIVIFFVRHKRRKHNNNRRSLKPVVDRHVTINLNDLRGSTNGKISNGNMYNSIATEELDSDREPSNHSGNQKLGKAGYVTPKDTIQGRHLPPYPTNSFFLFFFFLLSFSPLLLVPLSSFHCLQEVTSREMRVWMVGVIVSYNTVFSDG